MSEQKNILKGWLTQELQREIDAHPERYQTLVENLTPELVGHMKTMQYLFEEMDARRPNPIRKLRVQEIGDFLTWAQEVHPQINKEINAEADIVKQADLAGGKYKIQDLYNFAAPVVPEVTDRIRELR